MNHSFPAKNRRSAWSWASFILSFGPIYGVLLLIFDGMTPASSNNPHGGYMVLALAWFMGALLLGFAFIFGIVAHVRKEPRRRFATAGMIISLLWCTPFLLQLITDGYL